MKEAFSTPIQGTDTLRILTQIFSFQALHYLILATLLPPFLAIFAETSSLMFEGGPTQVGMVFDWRQIAGRPTYDWTPFSKNGGVKEWLETGLEDDQEGKKGKEVMVDPAILVRWNLDNVWLDLPLDNSAAGNDAQNKVLDHEQILRFKHQPNGTNTSSSSSSSSSSSTPIGSAEMSKGTISVEEALEHWEYTQATDSHRPFVLIVTWLLTIPLDILLLVYLVRRPTHILDHALTFHLFNLILTTWYTGELPKGLKWWLTMMFHVGIMVVWSEQLAIKRELGRSVGYNLVGNGDYDVESSMVVGRQGGGKVKREVVFDAGDEEEERIELRPL
ncbi:uncharacterized protein UTRI_06174_B [Ustilago trichophora]|uniref:Uncharacterized protein n=1 Tax=Ustilago trichophora TaxID=86804 RepID=A0A5C3EJK3_9BASI|nr:uncharacterized protein UTRI_06174_B [Ustilago trichophora]